MNDYTLEDIWGYAAARRVRLGSKARQAMSDLGLSYEELRYGLMRATACTPGAGDRSEVTTYQRSGGSLSVLVVFQDGLVVADVR